MSAAHNSSRSCRLKALRFFRRLSVMYATRFFTANSINCLRSAICHLFSFFYAQLYCTKYHTCRSGVVAWRNRRCHGQLCLRMLSGASGQPLDPESLYRGNRYLSNERLGRESAGYLMRAPRRPGAGGKAVGLGAYAVRAARAWIATASMSVRGSPQRDPRLDAWLTHECFKVTRNAISGNIPSGTFGSLVHENVIRGIRDQPGREPADGHRPRLLDDGARPADARSRAHFHGGGGQFNIVGEMLPHMDAVRVRSSGTLPAELAGLLSTPLFLITALSSFDQARCSTRPDVSPRLLAGFNGGWLNRADLGPYFFARFEDYSPIWPRFAKRGRRLQIGTSTRPDTSGASDRCWPRPRRA